MKKTILIISALIITSVNLSAQSCLPGGIHFNTQSQIDSFQINYPNCTEIEGYVHITGGDISNLTGLENLEIVGGLFIRNNNSLLTLSGLENLIRVYGYATIENNNSLTNLSGLENLKSVGGNFQIINNASLTSLSALESFKYAGSSFKIGLNPSLISLSGLEGLTDEHTTRFSITGNESLTSLSGLDNLTSVEYLSITLNPSLLSLSGLDSLMSIEEDLIIADNPLLSDITSLENLGGNSISDLVIAGNNSLSACSITSICDYLSSPNGIVEIHSNAPGCNNPAQIADGCGFSMPCLPYGNYYFFTQEEIDLFQQSYENCHELNGQTIISGDDIANLNGLNAVTSAGSIKISNNLILSSLTGLGLNFIAYDLEISGNPALNNLNGLESLVFIGDDFSISKNSTLSNLNGLEGLSFLSGDLSIESNSSLSSLSGLDNLTYIAGSLEFFDNESLVNLWGLDNLTHIGGSLMIGDYQDGGNPSLLNLAGLQGLITIGGSVYVGDNNSLVSLSGLNNLTSINSSLHIWGNPSLVNLSFLENLTQINGGMYISNNTVLPSLSGLENIDASTIWSLGIYGNDSLSYCAVQSVCDYLDSITGVVDIFNNKAGCNSPTEVASECGITLPCLPYGNYYINSQLDVDSFQSLYPGCTDLQGGVTIQGNDITNLDGLEVITSIEKSLSINSNESLPDLSGLSGLTTIGVNYWQGGLYISDNPLLNNLGGLENLSSVFYLSISNNSSLSSLSGVDSATTFVGWLIIDNNDALTSLTGLEAMTTAFFLGISNNDALISLTGLNNLQSIHEYDYFGSHLVISNNDALVDLTGLENLSSLGWCGYEQHGQFSISGNDALISLSGIQNIEATSIPPLFITNNPLLTECNVESVCDYLDLMGYATIEGNATGCDSEEEVYDECHPVFVPDIPEFSDIMIYPNPCSGAAHLRYSILDTRYLIFELYSIQGIRMMTILDKVMQSGEYEIEFDVSHLPAGMYFLRLHLGKQVETVKIVKVGSRQ